MNEQKRNNELPIGAHLEIAGAIKNTTNALRMNKNHHNAKDVDRFRRMSQDERESMYSSDAYLEIHQEVLVELMLSNTVRKLLEHKALKDLIPDEKYMLIEQMIITLGHKSMERPINEDQFYLVSDVDLNIIEVPEPIIDKKKRHLIDVKIAVDTLFSNSTILKLVMKMLNINKLLTVNDYREARAVIVQLLYRLDSYNDTVNIIELTFREYKKKGIDIDQYKKSKRVEVQYYLSKQLMFEGQINEYPLPSIEKFAEYTIDDNHNEYMLKDGLAQPQNILNVLNDLQKNAFTIVEDLDIGSYQGQLLEKYNKKYSFDKSDFIVANRTKSLQTKLEMSIGFPLYIKAKYDKRGRINRVAHQINPQGSDFEKATLTVHPLAIANKQLTMENKEVIKRNIYIAIAMLDGVDKVSFDARANYGKEHYETNAIDTTSFTYAWQRELFKSLDNMENTETYPNVAMGLDATNQGLQLYAVLTGDLQTAKTCNVASGEVRADTYQDLANELNTELNTDKFNRDNCKKALMITMYGSSKGYAEIIEYMYLKNGDVTSANIKFCIEMKLDAKPVDMGDGEVIIPGVIEFKETFDKVMKKIAPKAMQTMQLILNLNKELVKREYYWTMPDGFNVVSHSKQDIKYTVIAPKTRHSDDKKDYEMKYEDEIFSPNKKSKALPANVIQSIDAYVCREMIRRMNGEWINTIHDAFYCLPEHMELMIQNYKDIMCEILDSNLLSDILSELSGRKIELNKNNGLTKEHIQLSNFILS